MKSSKINLLTTALMTTMTIVIVAQPYLVEEKIASYLPNNLSNLKIE